MPRRGEERRSLVTSLILKNRVCLFQIYSAAQFSLFKLEIIAIADFRLKNLFKKNKEKLSEYGLILNRSWNNRNSKL